MLLCACVYWFVFCGVRWVVMARLFAFPPRMPSCCCVFMVWLGVCIGLCCCCVCLCVGVGVVPFCLYVVDVVLQMCVV